MEQFRCPICQTEFSTNEQLDRHMSQHNDQADRETGARSAPASSEEGSRDVEREGERRAGARSPVDFSCPRCGAEFKTREELDRHGRAQHPLR
jgi:uncharacterized C2H2 Zn-finger protein